MAATWAGMMAAMMLPSALPALVSLGRAARALAFAAGFLAVWIACGVVAFVAYDHSGLMDLSPYATAAVLAAAALYELTPLKRACLRRCRASAYSGPALARGIRYAVDCLGYCAGLMLALFALDPMSIVWMLAVSACVFVQVVSVGMMRGSALRTVKPERARGRAGGQQLVVRRLPGERDHGALERSPERQRNRAGRRAGWNRSVSASRVDQAGAALDQHC